MSLIVPVIVDCFVSAVPSDGRRVSLASSFKSSIGLLSSMPFELDPEEADWDDSLAVDSFTFWEEQAVASERIAAAPRIAKYVFFIVHYQPFF